MPVQAKRVIDRSSEQSTRISACQERRWRSLPRTVPMAAPSIGKRTRQRTKSVSEFIEWLGTRKTIIVPKKASRGLFMGCLPPEKNLVAKAVRWPLAHPTTAVEPCSPALVCRAALRGSQDEPVSGGKSVAGAWVVSRVSRGRRS